MSDFSSNILKIENLSVYFCENQGKSIKSVQNSTKKAVLRDISLKLNKNDKIAIVGSSGSGKTTLLRAIAGVLPAHAEQSGHIVYPHNIKPTYIMQEPKSALNPLCSVKTLFQRVLYHTHDANKAHADERIYNLLSRVHLPTDKQFLKKRSSNLSGGMAQRLMIALVLASSVEEQKKWVLADEVSSALDEYHEKKSLEFLCETIDSVVLVTHRMHIVKEYCNKVIALKDGCISYYGAVDDFFTSTSVIQRQNQNGGLTLGGNVSVKNKKESIKYKKQDVVLRLRDVCFSYKTKLRFSDEQLLLKNISFDIHKNEIICIRGETGCGKSTLASVLCGLRTPSSGAIYFNDVLMCYGMSKKAREMRSQIQVVPQVPTLSFHPLRSIMANLQDAIKVQKKTHGLDTKLNELCELVKLDKDILWRMPDQVSGGQLQRAACVRALLMSPQVLILDEPVSHLDTHLRELMIKTICDIKQKTGIAVCVITHLENVSQYIKKIHGLDMQYILEDGKLLVE